MPSFAAGPTSSSNGKPATSRPSSRWRALWTFSNDPAAVAFTFEFMALANHRKSIASEIATYAERFRAAQGAALEGAIAAGNTNVGDAGAAGLIAVLNNTARGLVMERTLGMTSGHDEAVALVDRYLDTVEPVAARRRR